VVGTPESSNETKSLPGGASKLKIFSELKGINKSEKYTEPLSREFMSVWHLVTETLNLSVAHYYLKVKQILSEIFYNYVNSQ